jgi:enamine deaminase RidA (YjgF/YER057c/UK114 family)
MPKRRAVHLPGVEHTNPIPAASVIDGLLASGSIAGRDPESGEWGGDLTAQCRLMFDNVRRVLEAAGGSTDDLLRMTVWLKDVSNKEALNDQWVRMFPDPARRPARHTLPGPDLPPEQWVQCEILAVISGDGAASGEM